MPLERWSPFREFLDLQKEMDRILRRTFGWPWRRPTAMWIPPMESYARGNDLVVKLDLPGVEPKDVDISIKDRALTIKGERRQAETVKEEDYYLAETEYGSFERTFSLPKEAKIEDIKATYDKGVLEIVVPQGAAVAEAKKVPIEVKA